MFADDTSLNASDKKSAAIQNELQQSISDVYGWYDKNDMILHLYIFEKKSFVLAKGFLDAMSITLRLILFQNAQGCQNGTPRILSQEVM